MNNSQIFESMGVINITPNSFSDGGKHTSSSTVLNEIQLMKKYGCKIFDFGAESTAPFNEGIDSNLEIERFKKYFLPILDSIPKDSKISIDTYKIETMRKLLESGLERYNVIFNDVSGSLDIELKELLHDYPNVIYVYSHNLCSSRAATQEHIKFKSNKYGNKFYQEVLSYFKEAETWFLENNINNQVWFDPCFGFSKDYQQNLDLIVETPNLIQEFGTNMQWLLGISKKSFLRKLINGDEEQTEQVERSEVAHSLILDRWVSQIPPDYQVVIRMHDVSLISAVKRCKEMFET
ncbi:MAG: dihydropteroate synthase [Bacteriovoracaceae bacterium]|nr:dihydropteroate synthase [Bacteriovoracaceae bacterium]